MSYLAADVGDGVRPEVPVGVACWARGAGISSPAEPCGMGVAPGVWAASGVPGPASAVGEAESVGVGLGGGAGTGEAAADVGDCGERTSNHLYFFFAISARKTCALSSASAGLPQNTVAPDRISKTTLCTESA